MFLYQNPIAMVDFVLNNLRRIALEGADSKLERLILEFNRNLLPTLRLSYTSQRDSLPQLHTRLIWR